MALEAQEIFGIREIFMIFFLLAPLETFEPIKNFPKKLKSFEKPEISLI